MRLASFTTVAFGALLFTSSEAYAGAMTCLTGTDPSVATDATQMATMRASISTACPCSSFDGSKGQTHGNYVKCATGEIANAVTAGQLRKQCKGTMTKYYALSTCGLPADSGKAPCVTTSTAGAVKCAIKPTAKCKGTSCTDLAACIDAADTNADGLIDQNDSGACNSTAPTPPPTPGEVPIEFTASLDGAQAGTASSATGSCNGTLNAAQTSFAIMCTHNVASPTAAHIHTADTSIVFPFSSPASPINATWSTITPSQAAALIAGSDYVNIHSNNCGACPGGEIRGQLLKVP